MRDFLIKLLANNASEIIEVKIVCPAFDEIIYFF